MRQTTYVKGYGYVTGDGIFDTIVEGIKTVASSKTVQDGVKEGFKAASKSAGDKLGSKIVEKAFEKKQKKPDDILKEIYGKSLFKK